MQPFLDSTDAVDDGAELLTRMERDGYLFIRNLLPVTLIEDLRMQILRIARSAGWVEQGGPLNDAVELIVHGTTVESRDNLYGGQSVSPHPNWINTLVVNIEKIRRAESGDRRQALSRCCFFALMQKKCSP